mgnify:CR=1 FL=1
MKQGNLNIRCTEDYAVLYWNKPAAAPAGAEYTVSLNGEVIGRTDKTHFTIEGLSYGSAFRVDVVSGSYCVGTATLQFGHEKRRIDITEAPYFCRGDGSILNTDNLRRGRYPVRACGQFPDRRTAAAQRSGNLSGQGGRAAGHHQSARLRAPHSQPI